MRAIYKAKHDVLLEELAPLAQEFQIGGEYAGIHMLLTGKKNQSESELMEKALAAGVRVYGLSSYFIHPEHNHRPATMVLGYASLREEEIREGIRLLVSCWK